MSHPVRRGRYVPFLRVPSSFMKLFEVEERWQSEDDKCEPENVRRDVAHLPFPQERDPASTRDHARVGYGQHNKVPEEQHILPKSSDSIWGESVIAEAIHDAVEGNSINDDGRTN